MRWWQVFRNGNYKDEVFEALGMADSVQALGGDDIIFDAGTNRSDSFQGGSGNDTIYTVNGNDNLFGGAGHDLFISINHRDFFVSGGPGSDELQIDIGRHQTVETRETQDGRVIVEVYDGGDIVQQIVTKSVEHFDW